MKCSRQSHVTAGGTPAATPRARRAGSEAGSTFIIVLWIAFGLVSLTLFFANSMSFELRASEERVAGLAAEQAIDGAMRYVNYVLSSPLNTNGYDPDLTMYLSEAVPVGDCRVWLIGRANADQALVSASPDRVSFGLVSEASKLNVNTASSNSLVALMSYLPRANQDLVSGILDWRTTNGGAFQAFYAMQHPPYQFKGAPFETVDELRLVYGADMETLVGEDANRNGVLDANEDLNNNGILDSGVLDWVTVYTREPGTYSNGTARVDISSIAANGPFADLVRGTFDSSRAEQILAQLGLVTTPAAAGRGTVGQPTTGRGGATQQQQQQQQQPKPFTSPLDLYRKSGMKVDEFGLIFPAIRMGAGTNYIEGRVNVNTASAAVLGCLPGLSDSPDLVQTLINYRQMSPDQLSSIGWIVDALGQNNSTALSSLAASDTITTQSYQFTADIAAVGPHGRGYRRTRFVFDTADGTPKVVFRQDLSHLGWALGKEVRQTWLQAKDSR